MKSLIAHIIDEEIQNSLYPLETTGDFIHRVYNLLMEEFNYLRSYAPLEVSAEIKEEILKEVTEVYRTKTYGHYNLVSYKKSLESKAS